MLLFQLVEIKVIIISLIIWRTEFAETNPTFSLVGMKKISIDLTLDDPLTSASNGSKFDHGRNKKNLQVWSVQWIQKREVIQTDEEHEHTTNLIKLAEEANEDNNTKDSPLNFYSSISKFRYETPLHLYYCY
jgi:hypothetical protein